MKDSLARIAILATGVTFRDKPHHASMPDSYLMQLGDLGPEGEIQFKTMLPFSMEKWQSRFVVKPGDLVFRGRGAGIVAAVMPETDLPIIIAAPLIMIRPNLNKIDPNYLAWALINNAARRYYAQYVRGSAILGIGKRDLELLEINLPTLKIQHKIGQIKQLENKENQLLARHQHLKAKLIEALVSDTLHKEKAA